MKQFYPLKGAAALILGVFAYASLAPAAKIATLTITPGATTFADQTVGTTSAALSFTVKNTSSSHVNFSSVSAFGDFIVTDNRCANLNPNGKCSVAVVFAPTTTGYRSGTLVLNDNAVNSPQVVALFGNGLAAPGNTPPPPPSTNPPPPPVPINQSPIVTPGADQSITLPATATLSATVTDDGLPTSSQLSESWSMASGPGSVSFSNPNSTATAATFSTAGKYVLALTATDGALSASATLTVTVAPAPVVTPPPPPSNSASNISGVWANEGEDKVSQDELRATKHAENKTGTVINRAWNGNTIQLTGAKNEVLSFDLVLEAATAAASNVTVKFDTLTGDSGFAIASKQVTGDGVFDWTGRNIELFYARYVQIKGLSFFGYYKGDERQVPVRFQAGDHIWNDRPDHDKQYPDALVPLELVPSFSIAAGTNQSIWGDVYIPKSAPPGVYSGSILVSESGVVTRTIPVKLTVQPFTLPDVASAKAFVNVDQSDIMKRFVDPSGNYVQWSGPGGQTAMHVLDRYFELLHRHKIEAIGENDCGVPGDRPCPNAIPRLTGSLYTAANGYDGPGVNTPTDIYSIGTYGTWGAGSYGVPAWKNDQNLFNQHVDNWQSWFNQNLPNVEHFIYLADEPQGSPCNGQQYCTDIGQVETWARWINTDPGPGQSLLSMSTYNFVPAQTQSPDLDIPTMAGGIGGCPAGVSTCNNTTATQAAADYYSSTPGKRLWMYNDGRPGSGTLMTESDGTDPRTLPWAQMKLGIGRWYYWFANVSCCGDFFSQALTWGDYNRFDGSIGWTGDNGTSNGNGLLLYPGTDLANPKDNYGVQGPVASLRLKSWRRGEQDADYIALARQIDPAATNAIVSAAIPKAIWENPAPGGDPSYFNGPITWSSNPDDWEAKRAQLAAIITAGCSKNPSASYCQ